MTNQLDKVCSEYCMNGADVYGVLISKEDEKFPLSYETIKYMVLKNVPLEILQKIFTLAELKNIVQDTNLKKIKNLETKKFIQSI